MGCKIPQVYDQNFYWERGDRGGGWGGGWGGGLTVKDV